MNTAKSTPRLLGAAFLFVIFVSLTSGLLFSSALGTGSISEKLIQIAGNAALARGSVLFEMLNSSGIVVLAALLYIVLHKHKKPLALIALGWWLAEAFILLVSSTGMFALMLLGVEFVKAGAPQDSFYQTLGQFLYDGLYKHGYSHIHMWFYCIGGMVWYSLFYQARLIPRAISLFGMVAVAAGFVGVVLEFFGIAVPIFVFLPILPFELAIGFWLLLRGIKDESGANIREAIAIGGTL